MQRISHRQGQAKHRGQERQAPAHIGIESFEDVLNEFTYVDKSLAVKELVDRRGVTLYCSARTVLSVFRSASLARRDSD